MSHGGEGATMPSAAELRADIAQKRALLDARESGLLALIWDRDVIHAGHVANELGMTPQGANNRLKRLVECGYLTRDAAAMKAGGRQYLYRRIR